VALLGEGGGAAPLALGDRATPWAAPVAALLRAAAANAEAAGEGAATAAAGGGAAHGPFSPPAALVRALEDAFKEACGGLGGATGPGCCTLPRAACARHAVWELRLLDWADTQELRTFSQLQEVGDGVGEA
jgi:hypothetical protein